MIKGELGISLQCLRVDENQGIRGHICWMLTYFNDEE